MQMRRLGVGWVLSLAVVALTLSFAEAADISIDVPMTGTANYAPLVNPTSSNSTITNNSVVFNDGSGGVAIGSVGSETNISVVNNGLLAAQFSGVANEVHSAMAIENNDLGSIWAVDIGIINAGSASITNRGWIGTLDGVSNDSRYGIKNLGTITELNNTGTARILGSLAGIHNEAGATIRSLFNYSTINSDIRPIYNEGVILTLDNSGSLISGYEGILNEEGSRIDLLNNSGTISDVAAYYGVRNYGLINTFANKETGIIGSSGEAIFNPGAIGKLNNDGYIGTTDGTNAVSQRGVLNIGTIEELNNAGTGTIMGSVSAIYNDTYATITNLTNSGTISSTGDNAIENYGTITALLNAGNGLITGTSFGLWNAGNIGVLTNSLGSTISGDALAIANGGDIRNIENYGRIQGGYIGAIYTEGTIGAINNYGTISATAGYGIYVKIGSVDQINNYSGGVIAGNDYAITSIVSIGSIYNFGTIAVSNPLSYAISNGGTLGTLVNGQGAGNPAGALTYAGNLPTNYQIVVSGSSSYGRLAAGAATGLTNFGIYNGSILSKGTYSSVLSGLTAGTNVNATSGMYNGTGWRLVETGLGTGVWDLIADYSASNTLAGIQSNANALSTVYNQQAAAYQAALSYDCQVYDAAGLCVSVGGRYTYAGPSPSSNQQAGLVIVGYKPVQTFRVGAFADQSVNISTPTGFSQSKTSPMWGFFAKWHKNKDETGLGVQASAVTSSSSLTSTRPQLFNTETGSGSTQFNGQGYQLTTNYHQPVTNNTSLVPYLGLRYTRINAGAYTENTTATVTSTLSYNAMAQNTFSAIGGIGVRSHLAEKLIGTASVGIQQNLNYSMGNYAGTSAISGLETFSVQMPGNVNSMATASAGLYYDVRKNERVGLNVLWQQQPFIATNTTTALATYTIGF